MRLRSFLPLLILGIHATLAAGCASDDDDAASTEQDAKKKSAVQLDVVFSPAAMASSHLARVAQEIDKAKTSIDIAMYSYSDANITAALAAASKRGVKLRFIYEEGGTDSRAANIDTTTSMKLENSGADVRFVNKIMHHKVMIIDGPRDDAAKAKTARLVTGSANWSSSAATKFDENTMFIGNAESLVLQYQREFDLLWEHSRDFAGKPFEQQLSTVDITDAMIPNTPNVGVVFTSKNFTAKGSTFSTTGSNTVADALVAGIASAKSSIHIASGHLRSRPVAEALIAKKKASPNVDIRVYLDNQEYLSKSSHEKQVADLDACLAKAVSEAQRRNCTDRGFLFGYQVDQAGVDVRYKYYAYRWDFTYAPQMHHKYMIVDKSMLWSGSYNLSDNAEHDTFENMVVLKGAENAATIAAYEANFESIWKTGRDENKLTQLKGRVEKADTIPIVFEPMALTWAEVTDLKQRIRKNCPAVDSAAYREDAAGHQSCSR